MVGQRDRVDVDPSGLENALQLSLLLRRDAIPPFIRVALALHAVLLALHGIPCSPMFEFIAPVRHPPPDRYFWPPDRSGGGPPDKAQQPNVSVGRIAIRERPLRAEPALRSIHGALLLRLRRLPPPRLHPFLRSGGAQSVRWGGAGLGVLDRFVPDWHWSGTNIAEMGSVGPWRWVKFRLLVEL